MFVSNRGEANIETLPLNIFVFVNEVFKKINAKFQTPHTKVKLSHRFSPRYHLEIYLRPASRNTSRSLREGKTKRTMGRQMKSWSDTKSSPQPQPEY